MKAFLHKISAVVIGLYNGVTGRGPSAGWQNAAPHFLALNVTGQTGAIPILHPWPSMNSEELAFVINDLLKNIHNAELN